MASEEDEDGIISIKSSLNAILRPEYANEVKNTIFERAHRMTEISALASLLILEQTNLAVDHQDRDFFLQDGKQVICDCFDAVTAEHAARMPPSFRDAMEAEHNGYQWPSKSNLGNSFNYYREQHVTNLQTNLNTHCEKRLKMFLQITCHQLNVQNPGQMTYDIIDIRNVLKDVMKDTDWTDGDALRQQKKQVLLQHLVEIGFPANTNLKFFVKSHWFQSIWPFIHIQRAIEAFLIDYAAQIEQWRAFNRNRKQREKPEGLRPPSVRNFSVLPLCNTHLKHIKIDITECYLLTSKLGAMPKYINPESNRLQKLPREHFTSKKLPKAVKTERKAELFNYLFKMDKIRRNGKQAKEFYGQINTDGVSASVTYAKQKRSNHFWCLLMIYIKYILGFFVHVIGIDPGDKTWVAGVRREMRTRIEVSNVNLYETIYPNTHL